VANLLIARASTRQREVAMRQALGATRARIARQLFTEILVLSAAGGAVGLLCAFWIVDLFELRTAGAAAALSVAVRPQPTVVLFAAVLSMVAALAAGVAPALGSSRSDLVDVLKQTGGATTASPGRQRLRAALAVVQIALSLVLIVGAGLFLRSLARLRSVEPSLATDRVIATTVNLNLRGYDESRGSRFYEDLLARVSAQPGIEAATLTSALPVTLGGTRINLVSRATRPAIDEPFEADMISASAGYFRTFGIPLVRGRDFAASDRARSRPVIIINETMKQRLWRGADPVGQTLFMADTTYEVIGVARDTKYRNLRESPRMTMYLPLAQSYASATNLVVRTGASTDEAVARVRREVQSLDAALPLYNVRTLAEHVERSLYVDAMRARLVSALALLAMALAAVGIYGLISFNAAERTREVGLRLALGARPSEVLRMVLATGARLALAGIGLGLLLSMSLTRLVATQLYGTAWDPIPFAGGALLLFVIVVLATLVPAVRVTRVDPMTALRYE
jgi:putative ABC transport system permease protein